jgi:hypothetical protein
VSPGVNGVSTGERGGMIGAGGVNLFELSSVDSTSERWEERSARTLDWKWGVVIGLVSISYYKELAFVLRLEGRNKPQHLEPDVGRSLSQAKGVSTHGGQRKTWE